MSIQPFVAVLIGSDSDLPTMQAALEVLTQFRIRWEVKLTSAHRTPAATQAYVKEAEARGCAIFIAGAGLAAHLAGTVAALTVKPVIGVPLEAGPLHGIDALLSTVQMPGGIPVACTTVGKAGAKNAAYLAAEILAVSDPELTKRLREQREVSAKEVLAKDAQVRERLREMA
jgi:phosphoribosylaminoimidazole carboxylase, PurE protein